MEYVTGEEIDFGALLACSEEWQLSLVDNGKKLSTPASECGGRVFTVSEDFDSQTAAEGQFTCCRCQRPVIIDIGMIRLYESLPQVAVQLR